MVVVVKEYAWSGYQWDHRRLFSLLTIPLTIARYPFSYEGQSKGNYRGRCLIGANISIVDGSALVHPVGIGSVVEEHSWMGNMGWESREK